jgi:hypothetical protein
LPEGLQALWHGSIHKLSSPSFTTEDGTTFEIAPDVHRRGTLGKKILLIDVDSRLDLSEGAMLNPDEPKKGTMKGRTAGILNHFLYGEIDPLTRAAPRHASLGTNNIVQKPSYMDMITDSSARRNITTDMAHGSRSP